MSWIGKRSGIIIPVSALSKTWGSLGYSLLTAGILSGYVAQLLRIILFSTNPYMMLSLQKKISCLFARQNLRPALPQLTIGAPGPTECGLTNPARAGMQQRQFALHLPWSPWFFVPEPLTTFKFDPDSPEHALGFEEALLDWSEGHAEHSGFLFFWESKRYFVVLGYGNRVASEVNQQICSALKIPILRRSSGGGTVLQGPGCVNYSIILPIHSRAELASITATNQFVMEQNRAALEKMLNTDVSVKGCTDLVLGDRKFSGNAQRRKKSSVLFHGSFLLQFDLSLVAKVLAMPSKQPAYRTGRDHTAFLTNLPISKAQLKTALCQYWETKTAPIPKVECAVLSLIQQKYANPEWNLKF
jgi:lipoate-protein ligase A